jgi:hypothetical protein
MAAVCSHEVTQEEKILQAESLKSRFYKSSDEYLPCFQGGMSLKPRAGSDLNNERTSVGQEKDNHSPLLKQVYG